MTFNSSVVIKDTVQDLQQFSYLLIVPDLLVNQPACWLALRAGVRIMYSVHVRIYIVT